VTKSPNRGFSAVTKKSWNAYDNIHAGRARIKIRPYSTLFSRRLPSAPSQDVIWGIKINPGAIIKKPACGGLRIGRVVHDFLPLAFIEETATSPATAPHVREFLGNLAQSGLKVERPAVGQMYDFGEGLSFECLNGYDLSFRRDSVNNSSICYRVLDNGRSILVTGDVSEEMGAKMVRTLPPEKLKSDVCFMAHHGQAGADKAFYAAVRPEVCIWPTPQWLWDNDFGGTNGPGSGEFLTNYVKCWMQDLGVKRQILLVRDWRMV